MLVVVCKEEHVVASTDLGTKQFCRKSPAQLHTRKRLSCFYMTFYVWSKYLPPTSLLTLRLPSSSQHIATHFLLSSLVNDGPPLIPVEQLKEYWYEDGCYETCMDLEARLRSFPNCRSIHERLMSYGIMSYERTIKTLRIVMEVPIDVIVRQCHLYLLQQQEDQHHTGAILVGGSMRLLCHDVGRMFVEAWRDYVMQSRYGREHPQKIILKLHRAPIGITLVS